MARTRQNRTAAQTVTIDAVDELVTQLNTISGIEFARDAWRNKAPEDYGVVELQGEVSQLWADGHLIDSIWRVVITAYVRGDDDTIAYTVQDKLEALEAEGHADLTHTISRSFDMQTGKTQWVWTVNLYGSLIREETAPAEEATGTAEAEPEPETQGDSP